MAKIKESNLIRAMRQVLIDKKKRDLVTVRPHYKTNFELIRTLLTAATFIIQLIILTHFIGG